MSKNIQTATAAAAKAAAAEAEAATAAEAEAANAVAAVAEAEAVLRESRKASAAAAKAEAEAATAAAIVADSVAATEAAAAALLSLEDVAATTERIKANPLAEGFEDWRAVVCHVESTTRLTDTAVDAYAAAVAAVFAAQHVETASMVRGSSEGRAAVKAAKAVVFAFNNGKPLNKKQDQNFRALIARNIEWKAAVAETVIVSREIARKLIDSGLTLEQVDIIRKATAETIKTAIETEAARAVESRAKAAANAA